ncbi:MAG: NAD-dependent epimerase/dehydratase family protein [Deltaproteobacteria bacterium]|nr:MAG: NAD-dependent epimerase/dehydratase family protein [Deltaproteobacteria bacterium]
MVDSSSPIVLTGAAGMVGLNLITLLVEAGYANLTAIDKNQKNLKNLRALYPGVSVVEADLSTTGSWCSAVEEAAVVFLLHAQIASKAREAFERNNVTATQRVLQNVHPDAFVIHVSSSVVHSVADDLYVQTKRKQESLVRESGRRHCVVRPTLMFGWFDGKHLGWLSRFMRRVPIFPIPGHGRYVRQPLYCRDFCRALMVLMERQPEGEAWDVTGSEDVTYIDMIRTIRDIQRSSTLVLPIPYFLFDALLGGYALVSSSPPFTRDQLAALVAGDHFHGVDLDQTFGVSPTPFEQAMRETLTHPVYAQVVQGLPH